MNKISLPACLPPWFISGCPDRWKSLIARDEVLSAYHGKMMEVKNQQRRAPFPFGILPARPPDAYEWGPPVKRLDSGTDPQSPSHAVCAPSDASSTLYGVVAIQRGETLSDIYGPVWDYVYNLEINREFRKNFPNPNKIQDGAQIRHPCHLVRQNQALAEYEQKPLEIPPLRSGLSAIKVPLNAPASDVQNVVLSAPCSGVVKTDLYTESFPNLETVAVPDCNGIIKSSKVTLRATFFGSENCPLRAENIHHIQKSIKDGEAGKEPKVGLAFDHWQVDVGSLGSLSVQDTNTGAKTEFGLVSGQRSVKSLGPRVEIGMLCVEPVQGKRHEGDGKNGGEKCSVHTSLQPAVKYDQSGRIEVSLILKYAAFIYENSVNTPSAKIDVEIEGYFVFDPKKLGSGLLCRPFSYRLDERLKETLKEFEHQRRRGAPSRPWEIGMIVVLGIVMIIVIAPQVAMAFGVTAGTGGVSMPTGLTSLLLALANTDYQEDGAGNPVLVIPVKK